MGIEKSLLRDVKIFSKTGGPPVEIPIAITLLSLSLFIK